MYALGIIVHKGIKQTYELLHSTKVNDAVLHTNYDNYTLSINAVTKLLIFFQPHAFVCWNVYICLNVQRCTVGIHLQTPQPCMHLLLSITCLPLLLQSGVHSDGG